MTTMNDIGTLKRSVLGYLNDLEETAASILPCHTDGGEMIIASHWGRALITPVHAGNTLKKPAAMRQL